MAVLVVNVFCSSRSERCLPCGMPPKAVQPHCGKTDGWQPASVSRVVMDRGSVRARKPKAKLCRKEDKVVASASVLRMEATGAVYTPALHCSLFPCISSSWRDWSQYWGSRLR
ncbi:hypothetical protein NDU88_002255 [Pleurodeles waltl]|uniref:Uncharacterized protein n=1 Tax=Pleurodeles waltl TaxID=8319 RepID=A0AAV7T1I7_PLEWA|nr:hypothetical protein NDU88_002254 [Pleurodeles waltl]KAJ1170378.1 hypothetical protein NDU88_002255 [Pleurodeles waltl]